MFISVVKNNNNNNNTYPGKWNKKYKWQEKKDVIFEYGAQDQPQ